MKKSRILICIICLLFIIIGAVALRFRGSHIISAKEDVVPMPKIVLYRQDDERWADETLGNSSYTMGKSGCLVSCIASAVTMAKEEKTPLTLNEEFSAQNVYDAEGNILWDALLSTGEYEVDVFKEVTEEFLIECLKDGRYPIARVRMYGLGNFHYVLIVKAENGEFYCMDPLEDELTKLSRYANRIYAVRCVSPAEYTGETEAGDEELVSEMPEAILETAETLTDLDIHPLYAAFLRNEISVPNPFVTGDELSFFDDRKYSQEEHTFENPAKCFSLVDVNNDGVSELVFKIYDYPDVLMYILGIQGDKLICYDVHETHTSHMAFGIYDNGIVTWGQNYDGDETTKCILQSNEEYKNLISPYEGEEPEWFSCNSFADISEEKNQ